MLYTCWILYTLYTELVVQILRTFLNRFIDNTHVVYMLYTCCIHVVYMINTCCTNVVSYNYTCCIYISVIFNAELKIMNCKFCWSYVETNVSINNQWTNQINQYQSNQINESIKSINIDQIKSIKSINIDQIKSINQSNQSISIKSNQWINQINQYQSVIFAYHRVDLHVVFYTFDPISNWAFLNCMIRLPPLNPHIHYINY